MKHYTFSPGSDTKSKPFAHPSSEHPHDELISKLETIKTPSYYDNSIETIYSVGLKRGWNSYVQDCVKRLERAERKGQFLSDIDKTITVLQLYKKEQGHRFKDQTEPLNK